MGTSDEQPEALGSTSTGLLQAAQRQDQAAWRRLVRLYGPLVHYWIRSAGLRYADAEDVLQEVFQAVARHLVRFRTTSQEGGFRAWLRTITRSKVADHFRRLGVAPVAQGGSEAQRQFADIAADASSIDSSVADDRLQQRRLRLRAMESIRGEFAEGTWQAFWRTVVEGEAPKDIARDLGVTPSAVRLAKSRVLRRLRDELE